MTPHDDTDQQSSAMRAVVEQYAADAALVRRYYDIPLAQGDLDARRAFFRDCQEAVADLDFGAMGQAGRIDLLLLRNQVRYELRRLEQQERWNREVAPFLPFAEAIVSFAQRRRAVERVEPSAVAAQLAALARQVEEARKALEARLEAGGEDGAQAPRAVANRAATLVGTLRETLKRAYSFYNEYDPLFTWWAGEPYQKADKTLEDYAAFLREKLLGIEKDKEAEAPIVGDPIGREALGDELAHAMIPYTPEELIAVGERELAWCEAEMVRAARDLGCGDDWHQALERVKGDHVPPGEQPYLVRDLAVEAIAFLDQHDLLTIPPLARELWRVDMMPPERQKVNPFFTGGETITVSYPTSAMPHDEKLMSLRGNNVHFARATVHHELIPGHHLQGFMAARHRRYRRAFHTPFFLEGWALYWEMLLWDLGFPRTPENHIGMLFWRMHRAARIIFSLRFHLGTMTPDECIAFLIERVGFEPANARAEVKRAFEGDYNPLYQCAYMVGGLQLRALHGELVASGRMTPRQFHDALLRENSIPIELIRARLTGQELAEDFPPGWRFARDPAT